MALLHNILPIDARRIASFLAHERLGALALGRAEVGPRALGNRSILADPRRVATKERINGLVKDRMPFQPLAPACLVEDVETYFELPAAEITLSYMTTAVKCKPLTWSSAPAVVHADGSARVQVVHRQWTPLLADILEAFRDLTGVGLLINTSLNAKGEPIVNTAEEAFRAYKRLDLDFVVIGRYLISSRLC